MKLSGPASKMKAAWEAIGKNITLEPQKGDDTTIKDGKQTLTFLGCEATKYRKEIQPGKYAECI